MWGRHRSMMQVKCCSSDAQFGDIWVLVDEVSPSAEAVGRLCTGRVCPRKDEPL